MLSAEIGPGQASQRRAFVRMVWRLVRSWAVVAVMAVVLGLVLGGGEIGPWAIPLLAIFAFVFALPGSLLTIWLMLLIGGELGYSFEARIARIGALSVGAAASVIVIAFLIVISLQTPSSQSLADALTFVIFVVPAAVIWEVIDG